jgi:hypothetical protein
MQTSTLQINGICGSGLDNAIYNASFNPPLITDYTFDIVHENYCFGSEGDISISGNANSCYNAVEIDTSINKTLKLEILNGKEFVSFYQNGIAKDSATVRYDNKDIWNLTIKDIFIKQDSFYTGSAPFEVITKSDWAGEIKYDTISIDPQTPTQIYVSDEQPRKVYTGFSSIQVKTYSNYSSDSCWTEMPDSVKYRAVIIKGQNLANLIDYSTGNGGDMLINLDHNNGQRVIGFETEGENLTEQDTVIVSISTTDPNINTVQAMLIIMPGDINVQIIPGTISQGDTARVLLKKRGQNGLEDFPADKLFNVEIINGMEYGLVLDSLSNDTLTTFSNILQGFKIIATDSTGIDSTKIRIKVNTEESVPAARLSRDNTKTNVTERAQTENNDDETILPDWIVPGGPIIIEGFGDVVVKEGCDEEIVVCNSFEPQKFDDPGIGIMEKLISNAPWSWIDPLTKTPKNTDAGEGCNEGNSGKDVGLTYVMSEVGPYSQSTPTVVYKLSDDILVETCLDEQNPNNKIWRFKIKNVRVPIFADVCSTFISNRNFIDLKDGNDYSLLSANINNCIDLKRVLSDIDWDINSPYSHPCEVHPVRYVFSAGIRAHELKHYNDIIEEVKKHLNEKTFPDLINKYYRLKADYNCPEDALNRPYVNNISMVQALREFLFNYDIRTGANIKQRRGYEFVSCISAFPFPFMLEYKSEIDADKEAQRTYREIRSRILTWAKMQSWYDPTKLNCLGIK